MSVTSPVLDAWDLLRELYPSPNEITRPQSRARADLVPLPRASDVRLLVPADTGLAAISLRHARRPLNRRGRLESRMVGAALRAGAVQRVLHGFRVERAPTADSIERHLESVLGQPVIIGIFLGPKRANRKPVLQVMGQDGRLLAIAKIGLTPLSRQLAATEAAALTELKSRWMPVLTPPDVLHFGEWRGHSVLVQSPLNLAAAPIHIDPDVRRDAMLELAHFGEVRTLTWSESDYLDRLEARLSHLSSSGLVSGMRDGIKWLRQRPSTIRFGTWHGDWTAWNMAVVDGKALVWDWERYEHDVPIGFDALHYAFMPALKGRHPKTSGINLLDSAPRTLDRFGSDPLIAKEIAVCYLMDLAIRYLSDGQADTGVAGGDAAQWLMPVLSTVRTGVSEEMDDQNG